MKPNCIAYLRVSTNRQSVSGLGLQAQRELINSKYNVIKEFIEIESGKKDDRAELLLAIDECKKTKCTLAVAKLDRLSRNASFLFTLHDSKLDFFCFDMPELNTLTLGILATFAQHERERISERTKSALQQRKKQGKKLGNPNNLTMEARKKGGLVLSIRAKQNQTNRMLYSTIRLHRERNLTYDQIVEQMNKDGFKTITGKPITKSTISHYMGKSY
jgi:DNA invertase Pin-like site-specific DNA recombinase